MLPLFWTVAVVCIIILLLSLWFSLSPTKINERSAPTTTNTTTNTNTTTVNANGHSKYSTDVYQVKDSYIDKIRKNEANLRSPNANAK